SSGFRVARLEGPEGMDREITLPADFLSTLRAGSTATGIVQVEYAENETDENSEPVFSHYVPCAARSRVVAVVALGRTSDGALLSSEDAGLLRAISGYVAVAIENALLLEDQAQRSEELARMKEFSENIIESINVGVLVVNLAGRITNWNTALEEVYGLKREQAISHRVTEVFQPDMLHGLLDLMSREELQKGEPVNIYKFRAHSLGGQDLTLNISLAPLQSKTAEIEGTLIAIEDVTA